MFSLDDLSAPIVQAPMAGGISGPALAAAVGEAGGLGFLAAGYRTAEALREEVAELRGRTARPFGVNLFAPTGAAADPGAVAAYAARLEREAAAAGVALGEPRFDDDRLREKVAALAGDPVAVVSFTFGCPDGDVVHALHRAGTAVWVTVTDAHEARTAAHAGADALVVQGAEAGGHRGSFADTGGTADAGLLALLQLVAAAVDLPLVATGGIATGRGVAAVLAAGARAAQLGTAFALCPEAGTAEVHRRAIAAPGATAVTRAFTGRRGRGIVNRFLREHDAAAPSAYPEVHHLTAPLRARARLFGDGDALHLWAGEAHELARAVPAGRLVTGLAAEARAALDDARRRC